MKAVEVLADIEKRAIVIADFLRLKKHSKKQLEQMALWLEIMSSQAKRAQENLGNDDEFLQWWYKQEEAQPEWMKPKAFNALARAAFAGWKASGR